jgi:hypothetical protein
MTRNIVWALSEDNGASQRLRLLSERCCIIAPNCCEHGFSEQPNTANFTSAYAAEIIEPSDEIGKASKPGPSLHQEANI